MARPSASVSSDVNFDLDCLACQGKAAMQPAALSKTGIRHALQVMDVWAAKKVGVGLVPHPHPSPSNPPPPPLFSAPFPTRPQTKPFVA